MALPERPTQSGPEAAWAWLYEAIRVSDATTVLTGSGVSSASGLHTYRSEGSPWPAIELLQHADTYRQNLATLWPVWASVQKTAARADPTPSHVGIAALQQEAHRRGADFTVITQNVDGLHTKAGAETLEVHGSLHRVRCDQCQITTAFDDALLAANGMPECADCGCVLRPDMVLFGERPFHTGAIDTAIQRAELMLVIGTSGVVHPVASLPRAAASRGAVVVLLNDQEWEDMSSIHLGFGGDCNQIISELAAPDGSRAQP